MSRHPMTPMDEADIRLHLAKQTDRSIGLVDLAQLDDAPARLDSLIDQGCRVILFDTVSESDLAKVGKAIWESRGRGRYVVGSSGAEYALVAYWRETGEVGENELPHVEPVDQIAVVSGSCSPVTAGQIAWAEETGFEGVALTTERLVGDQAAAEVARAVEIACSAIAKGKSVIVHSGRGPDDPRIGDSLEVLRKRGWSGDAARSKTAELIGSALGDLLRQIVERTGLARVATTGGDTSYFVARQMGVTALEAIGPMAPGSPLCRVHATPGSKIDGCEVTFKGGQVGKVSFFGEVLSGEARIEIKN